MLIAQIETPQDMKSGDFFYRTYAPGLAMSRQPDIYVVNLTYQHRNREQVMAASDVLIIKGIADPDLLPLIDWRRSQKKITIFEISDDYAAVQPWNPVYFFYQNKENLSLLFRIASRCDAIQFSCVELRRLYGHLNEQTVVFPNQISRMPTVRRKRTGAGIVIGWGGSHGHLEDIRKIARPLSGFLKSHSQVSLAIMGSEDIRRLFDGLPEEKITYFSPGSLSEYESFLRGIDIGIAPLNDTAFNRSRSDVKFLEYAAAGAVPVMQNLEPYRISIVDGKNGFLFNNWRELAAILSHLIGNPRQLETISRAAEKYVVEERNQEDHASERIEYYAARISAERNSVSASAELFSRWVHLEGAERNGRHLLLNPTRFESILHDGLVAMQMADQKNTALRYFEEAIALMPDIYFPYLYAGAIASTPESYLRKAETLNPRSLRAKILLGEAFIKKGKVMDAFRCFDEAAKLYPDYEIPFLRAASLLQALGQKQKAESLQKTARQLAVPF